MAYKSEIEFKVRVLDSELRELENKLKSIKDPLDVGSKALRQRAAAIRATKTELNFVTQALEDQERLAETKAKKTRDTNIKRLRFIRSEKLRTARLEKKARLDAERKVRKERLKTEREARNAQRAAERRRADITSNVLIGGAFPLLFGQGLGAAAGGALGGGIGGALGGQFGFAGSLVGTGIGQAVDTFIGKAAALGKALNPLTANLDEVVKAAGASGTATEKYIQKLEELSGKTAALDAATSVLASRIGNEGVEALKEFGNDVASLSREFTLATTQLASAISDLINRAGILKALTSDLNKGRLLSQAISDPTEEQKPLVERFENARRLQSATLGFAGTKEIDEAERALVESQITRELNAQLQIKSDAQSIINKNVLLQGENLSILKIANKIEEQGADLKVEAVQNLARQKLELELVAEQQRIINELTKEGADFFAITAKLQALSIKAQTRRNSLENDIADAINRGAKAQERRSEASRREAEQEERAFQSSTISRIRSEVTLAQAQNRFKAALDGREAALEQELDTYDQTSNKLREILKISFEQRRAQTDSARIIAQIDAEEKNALNTLNAQVDTNEILKRQDLQRLKIARERASEELKVQLSNRVEDAKFGLRQAEIIAASPFGGQEQQTQLFNLEQERERLELTRQLTSERKNLEQSVIDLKGEDKKAAEQRLINFDLESKRLEEILNQRQLVEQQQLRQNQLLEKYGFIIDEVATAVSSSIQAIITGTGSVQEAFATMFENIGRAFIDLATQVLAQKAFLAVINALNPGASLFSSGSSGFNLNGFGSLAPDAGSGASGFLTGVNFFANGGNPPVNRPSIVGERGPELFVPRSSGTIVPNETLDALSRYRPTSSAEAASQTVNVNYSVTEVNGMRYVTEEQFRAGLDQAAKRGANMGKTMTISTLRNSRSQRSKIGL